MMQLHSTCKYDNKEFINHSDKKKNFCNLDCNTKHYKFMKTINEEQDIQIKDLIQKYIAMQVPICYVDTLYTRLKTEKTTIELLDNLKTLLLKLKETDNKAEIEQPIKLINSRLSKLHKQSIITIPV